MTPKQFRKAKEVECYSQGVAAWYNSAMEKDKSLLTLSTAGLGVLLALMPTGIGSMEALVLYLLAITGFLICIVSVLMIFSKNKKHLENVLHGITVNDWSLKFLDYIAVSAFIASVVFSTIIGVSLAVNTYLEKDKKMTEENQKTKIEDNLKRNTNLTPCLESFYGAAGLYPQATSQKVQTSLTQLQARQHQTPPNVSSSNQPNSSIAIKINTFSASKS
jgi:hypothetical protein